jgi:hypothetical protein
MIPATASAALRLGHSRYDHLRLPRADPALCLGDGGPYLAQPIPPGPTMPTNDRRKNVRQVTEPLADRPNAPDPWRRA